MVPQAFSPKSDKQTKSEARGRPSNMNKAFLKVAEYLQHNHDEQITILDLVDKMKECNNNEAYTAVHMKRKIKEHFGDKIVITEMHGKSNVVTFRETAKSILQNCIHVNRVKTHCMESLNSYLQLPS